MKMKKVKYLLVLIAVIIGTLLGVFLTNSGRISEVHFALNSEISSLDPAQAFDDSSLLAIGQSYETLYEYHYLKRPYELIPLLAASPAEISLDGKTVTIKIRPQIYYHPHPLLEGKHRTVVAQDFINQIKRLFIPSLQSPGASFFRDILEGATEFQEQVSLHPDNIWDIPFLGVSAPDPLTLVFHLKQKTPTFLNLLALTFVTPIPIEILRTKNFLLAKNIIGTGPYILNQYENHKLQFSRFNNYHQSFYPTQGDRIAHMENWLEDSGAPIPFMDKLSIYIVPEESERWKMFLSGELDWTDVPEKIIDQVVMPDGSLGKNWTQKGYHLQIYPRYSGRWLSFNMSDPVWSKNLLLRKAISFAIDREKYIKILTGQTALKANSLYFPGILGYGTNKDLPFTFDLEKSKALLKEAGFPMGRGLPPLHYYTRGNSESSLRESKIVKEMLAQIGINVMIHPLSFPDFLNLGRQGKLSFFTDGWIMDYPDPSNILQLLLKKNHPGINKSVYSNKDFDKLFQEYTQLKSVGNDSPKILELLNEMEQIVLKDLPWIMLYIHRGHIISKGEIKNLRSSTFIRNYIKYLNKK